MGKATGNRSLPPTCVALHVGVWSGAERDEDGLLLYRSLVNEAARQDVQGATVWNSIEGASPNGRFKSVENEVTSNELPIWMTLMDNSARIHRFVEKTVDGMKGKGLMCSETVRWMNASGLRSADEVSAPVRSLDGLPGTHIQVFMLESAKVNGKPVYQAVAERLRHDGILWMSTMRGLSGYGEGRKVRGRRWFGQVQDVPVTMHIVDTKEKLDALLPGLLTLVDRHALVVASDVSLHT